MKISKLLLTAAAFAFAALPSPHARADTFQIFNLGIANSHTIFGIDTAGIVVIQFPSVTGNELLYQTYVSGVLINSSTTIPSLTYDNGVPCSPAVSPPITYTGIGRTRCNGGHAV